MSRTILLVEDNVDDVTLVRRAFRKANIEHPMHVVVDGDQAIAYLSGAGEFANRSQYPLPSLVLLDLKLPRKSGLEVLSWIRTQPLLKRLLVVVLTSSRESNDVNDAYDVGANSYLVKPVEFDALLELARSLEMYWLFLNEHPTVGAD
jgi:CheY-like chemotaxis protein